MSTVLKKVSIPHRSVKESVNIALSRHSYSDIIKASEKDYGYLTGEVNRLQLHDISNYNYEIVKNIGQSELISLNSLLKDFTSKLSALESPGLFTIIDDLSKSVSDADLEAIWEKTRNTKPTLGARLRSWFSPSAAAENLQQQYKVVYSALTTGSKGLEVKLLEIEKKLNEQRLIQERNISTLNSSFEMYYNVLDGLRKELILVIYMEEDFNQKLSVFEKENKDSQEARVLKLRNEYQEILSDLQNKRLTLHSTILKIGVTTVQNNSLVTGCRKVLKEIDHTLNNSFITIRGNLVGLGVALNTQQSLLSTQNTRALDKNLSTLNMRVNSELAVSVEKYSSESRLKEAQNTKDLINNLTQLTRDVLIAKEQSKLEYQQSTELLKEATNDFQNYLKENVNASN